jgi:extracellular factor (EF) 3-hydroxypalmitic acid methyl ester biosynthesis protein
MQIALSSDVGNARYELNELEKACRRMQTLATQPAADTAQVFHATVAAIHGICEALVLCEGAGVSPEELRERLIPIRQIHARSPFMRRLQEWPRSYAGDFETIEWLWRAENCAQGPFARALEAYALTSAIAQQHRNKVAFQASCMLEAQQRHWPCRVLSLACGSSPDLRSIVPYVRPATTFVLCDSDAGALEYSHTHLDSIAKQCVLVQGRVPFALRSVRRHGPFHLIVAGGLFDYLPNNIVERTLVLAFESLLTEEGRLVFTNLAKGNPFRVWLEYVADWPLLERSEADLLALAEGAGLGASMTLTRDATGLAILASISRR